MRSVSNYILLVDAHKLPQYCYNTKGRYKVGAKTEREAMELLMKKIKFGSIQVCYKCELKNTTLKYKCIVKEV